MSPGIKGGNFLSVNIVLDKATDNEAKMDPKVIYDVLIIGGGPAGLNAALYSKRKGAEVGILAKGLGGQIIDTSYVENYLGFEHLTGMELADKFEEHVRKLNIPLSEFSTVESVELSKDKSIKEIKLSDGSSYKTRALIIATGSKPRKLNVPGEVEFSGKGVAYCAICDGPFFAEQDVIVAGGGNSAVEAALDLAKIANKVTIVHRSIFRADKILVDQLMKLDNVDVKLNTQIQEIFGDGMMDGIKVLDKSSDQEYSIFASGIFVEIGYLPNSEVFKDTVKLNKKGEILVDKYGKTDTEGIFAAGDVTDVPYKQIIISAADGAKCALSANEYLNKIKK